jgi:hypothetical protein
MCASRGEDARHPVEPTVRETQVLQHQEGPGHEAEGSRNVNLEQQRWCPPCMEHLSGALSKPKVVMDHSSP